MERALRTNRLKAALQAGQAVYGPFVRLATPQVVEILGYAGFDFCVIDMEHGSLETPQVENMVRAAERAGLTPIVRTSYDHPWQILRALDTGAQGVQVPGIGSAEAARTVVRNARYYPEGERGVCRFVRAAEYANVPASTYFEQANKENLVILHVEGAAGVENLDEILAVPGIDVIFLGPYDLSQYLGLTGQVEHPRVIDLLQNLISRIRARGVAVGIFTDNPARAAYWRAAGVQYISVQIDTGMLYEAARGVAERLRAESGQ